MDDLDHSMHIAECDWASFYEECEECGLLQPSLACPDNLSLSDSEDSGNSGQQELQQAPAANSNESNAAGYCIEVQINQSGSENNLPTEAQEDSERQLKSDIFLDYPKGNTTDSTEETNDNITITLQTEQLLVQSSDEESTELRKDEKEGDTSSIHEPDPLSCNQTELNVNEPQSADRAVSEDVSRRAEKERWFVTVNDSPARQRVRATSVKKKRRQKKPCKNNHICRTLREEKSSKNDLELERNRDDNNESGGGRDTECVTQSNQNSGQENPESVQMGVISDVLQMSSTSGEKDISSEKLEPSIDRNKHDLSSSTSTSQDTLTAKDPPRWDSMESDEFVDGVEFFSTHSYDSESYLSATESVEESQHLLVEYQQLQSSSTLTKDNFLFNLTENTDTDHQETEMQPTATNSESYESNDVEPTLNFPPIAQSANKMPDDVSTCNNDTHSMLLHTPSNTPGLQKHEINLSASGCTSGDQPSVPTVPDVTVTPCSAANSPETYAEAAGNTRPVYAISAFWDEMEKLTINDILQLRMGRSISQETVTANADFPNSSLVHTVEHNLPDSSVMDTSDTADSDYFTQPDESKPDRSSCEFSTSDFEEEYWQFLGTSRTSTPDLESKNQPPRMSDSFFAHEEEESTSSEGRDTPVPSEDFAGECLDSDVFISSELVWPRQITKSKSVRDVQALNTDDLSLQLLLGDDESSLFLSSCPSLKEDMVLKASDSLIPAPFLSNSGVLDTQVSFPEVFGYFFTEDKAKRDSRCVTVYDPEDISVAPVFDYTLCTWRDESSFSSLADSHCSDEKPIPIFSCSHPTVRELTFPNQDYVFLSAPCEDEDDFSPIRVVSHSFILGSDDGVSEAAPRGFHSWKSLLSIRKIRFHDKGSIWCSRSGAWVFPVEAEKITIETSDPPIIVVPEGKVSSSTPSQLFRELAVQQRILGTIQTTRREGIFSTLKQSDMCLVCIAFASWVLRSSDPKAADAWKAALLANVSALSAIQYLRQYMKKNNPSQDDP